ncbi:MAG: DUF1836 domain-containing protein [Oscillospiraceae bacterium]|nr:DUF1836 domain-containing protein [Oscillospiraceae bacterium]
MNESSDVLFTQICRQMAGQTLPRWDALPDLDLYMDQVLALVDHYLGDYPGFDEKGLTASMVNNYVKLKVIPAPTRKRYTRTHLAYLIIICVLKPCLSITFIQQLLSCEQAHSETPNEDGEQPSFGPLYNRFCDIFEQSVHAVAKDAGETPTSEESSALPQAVYYAALRAQAEQALATKYLSLLFDAPKKTDKAEKSDKAEKA